METDSNTRAAKHQQWETHISAWQSSGLSQTQFCKQHGLTYSTFLYWRSRLKASPLDVASARFVPVAVAEPSCSDALILELNNGVRVQITREVDLQWLGRVVQVLQTSA